MTKEKLNGIVAIIEAKLLEVEREYKEGNISDQSYSDFLKEVHKIYFEVSDNFNF